MAKNHSNPTYNEDKPTTRHAAIQEHYYPPLKSDTSYNPLPRPIPGLNLRGHWLQNAGFLIGAELTINIQHQKLVITVDNDQE